MERLARAYRCISPAAPAARKFAVDKASTANGVAPACTAACAGHGDALRELIAAKCDVDRVSGSKGRVHKASADAAARTGAARGADALR